jgi:tetratricopeptide (TPR) repeat protein
MTLEANGFDEKILECYLQAERFDPKNPRWPYLRGLHVLEGNRPEGILLFRQALSRADRSKDRAAILFRLARVLLEDQQLDEVDRDVQALRQIEPDSPRAHFALGLLAAARDDRPAARTHMRMLTDLPFARKYACALLASLEDEDRQAARAYMDRSAQLPRDEPWPDSFEEEVRSCRVDRLTRIAKFWDLKKQGRIEEATDFLRAYVAQQPDAEVCYIFGFHLFSLNQFDEAEQVFRLTLQHAPSHAKAHLILGEVLYQNGEKLFGESSTREQALGRFREAVAVEERALTLEPTFGLAHLVRGRALKRLGRTDEALRAFREALLLAPQMSEAYLALGETLAELGQFSEGLDNLEKAVQFALPGDSQPRDVLEKWRTKAPQR